jgi:hypothetical protein
MRIERFWVVHNDEIIRRKAGNTQVGVAAEANDKRIAAFTPA